MVSCLGSLVQSCCGEGGVLQTNVTGLCGEHSLCSGHTGFAPLTGVCFPCLHCSGSRLLYLERALPCVWFQFLGSPQKCRLGWACVLCLPRRSSSGSLTSALSPGAVRLLPSVVLASVSTHARASLVCLVSLLGSWFLNCDPPGRCPPSRILGSLWLETRSLFAVR